MPTASGRPTADEKRQAQHEARIEAFEALMQDVPPGWIKEATREFLDSKRHAYDGPNGEMFAYEAGWPRTADVKHKRITLPESQVRAFALMRSLRTLGFDPLMFSSFGWGADGTKDGVKTITHLG